MVAVCGCHLSRPVPRTQSLVAGSALRRRELSEALLQGTRLLVVPYFIRTLACLVDRAVDWMELLFSFEKWCFQWFVMLDEMVDLFILISVAFRCHS